VWLVYIAISLDCWFRAVQPLVGLEHLSTMVNFTLRNSSEQTFAPYKDDPNSDSVPLLGSDPYELLSDDGLEDQIGPKKPSALHLVIAKAGSLAISIGKLHKKRDGIKRKISCCRVCSFVFLCVFLFIIIFISSFVITKVTLPHVRCSHLLAPNWTGPYC
jgi:hypothetical protein